MSTAEYYYLEGAATYDRYAEAKAQGASSEQAAGQIAGSIGGAAGCAAVGAAAASPLCASIGASIGSAIASLFGGGGGGKNYARAICIETRKTLTAMVGAAKADGIAVSYDQAQRWFADAANRDILARHYAGTDLKLTGDYGGTFAVLRTPMGPVFIHPNGALRYPASFKGKDVAALKLALPWMPPNSYGCLRKDVTVGSRSGMQQSAAVGLAAVGARIAQMRKRKRRKSVAHGLFWAGLTGTTGWLAWKLFRKGKRR